MSATPVATPRPAPSGASHPVALIVRGVLIENIRRREFYVVLIIMSLYLLGVFVTRIVGIQNAATATFLTNLGLTMAFAFAQLLALLTAVRQIPDEVDNRTLYPLLAKPVGRGQYLLGKWLAGCLSGVVTLLLLTTLTRLAVPQLEPMSAAALVQGIALLTASIAMISAASLALSLHLAKIPATAVLTLWMLFGGYLMGLLRAYVSGRSYEGVVIGITNYLPNPDFLNLAQHYTNGSPALDVADFAMRLLYAGGYTLLFWAYTNVIFSRRPL